MLVLTLLAAGALALYLRADWRDRSQTWALATWQAIRSSLEQPATKPQGPSDAGAAKTTSAGKNNPDDAQGNPRTPAADKDGVRSAGVDRPAIAPPAQTKLPPPAQPKMTEPPPEIVPAIKTPPTPAVVDRPATPALVSTPGNMTPEQTTVFAQALRSKAIDAEGSDWPAALRMYEQIEQLPRESWPADLQVRLNRARDRAR